MEIGSLVIANDLVGFVTGKEEERYVYIQDSSDSIHKVVLSQVHLIIDPVKYLYMMERKLCKIEI